MGSIPAHAGEPWLACCALGGGGVYPRPCGGTVFRYIAQLPMAVPGLSPPMRGNPLAVYHDGETEGSIPAHAGEPGRGA